VLATKCAEEPGKRHAWQKPRTAMFQAAGRRRSMRRQKRLLIYLLDERQELAASLVMNCFSLRDQEIITEELIRYYARHSHADVDRWSFHSCVCEREKEEGERD
jgi:hypothetical protein